MRQIIKNGTIVTGGGSFPADILIDGEKIAATGTAEEIGKLTQPGDREIDAAGCLIFPGFIDAHTHFDLHVAGTITADDFATGTKAALRGGTTTIIDFGTQYPGETLAEGLKNWHEKADGKLVHRELSYRFFIGNTCGCTKHVPFDTESFRNRIFWKNLQEYDAKSKLDSMQEWVTSRISLEEIMDATGRFLDLVGAGRGQIFLTDDLFSQEAKSYRSCKREVLNWCNEKNRTEEGGVQVFMPLHYQLHRMGYCMVAGVDEMFRTGILETFFRNICYALENYIQRKQYQEVNLKLQKLYRIDQLTGIYNRFGMEDLGQKFYEKNCEYHVNTKFIFCDINRLKYINDTYGHKAGDWVIRKTGEALGRLTAEDSLPFRFGGDEFLLLTREESGITAESIRQSIAVVCGEETSPIRESLEVSIGVILAPWDSEYNMDVYLNQADEAMYEEKKMYHEKYGDRRRR